MTEERRSGEDRRRRNGPKVPCPSCRHRVSVVLPDRVLGGASGDDYRRVRRCAQCGVEFTSLERTEEVVVRRSPAA